MSAFDAKNPPNWRGAENPYDLRRPPIWWLKRLWEQDDQLRVFPGLTQACYRITRRSPLARTLKPVLGNDSETGRLCREMCLPVVSLVPTVEWDTRFFRWLEEHDMWAVQTAYRNAADVLDEFDARAQEKQVLAQEDEVDQRSVSAWHSLQMRTGQKVFTPTRDEWVKTFFDSGESGARDTTATVTAAQSD